MDLFITNMDRNSTSSKLSITYRDNQSKASLHSPYNQTKRLLNQSVSRNQSSVVNDYNTLTLPSLKNTLSTRRNTHSLNHQQQYGQMMSPAKRLQPKEYFQKYIRQENKQYIQRQRQLTVDNNQYIEYDRHNKQSFRDKVQQYMQLIDKEEEIQQKSREQSQELLEDQESIQKFQIEELQVQRQSDSVGTVLPPVVINQQNKAVFMVKPLEASAEKDPKLSKKKELPRYMQPNIAWLSKDKTSNPELSLKDQSHQAKSKGSSLFPTLAQHLLKRSKQKPEDDAMLIEDGLTNKQAKQANKYFVINREDPLIIELFKKICQEKRDSNIIRARLTKGKMKAHLSRKYKGKVAEKILLHLDFSVPLDFQAYCDLLEKLLNFGQEKLKRIAFNVFDFNNDRYVCQLDLYSIMKMYESDDTVFVNAYSYDICKLIAFLDQKKIQKGNENYELNQKLKGIQRKVEQAMKAYAAQKHLKYTYKRSDGKPTSKGDDNTSNMASSIQRTETDEDDDDEDSFLEDDFEDDDEDEMDKTTTNKSKGRSGGAGGKTSRSHKSGDFLSRRNSVMSRKSVVRKDFKRMNTNMSRMSRTSRVSKNSGKSQFSGRSRMSRGSKRYQGGFFSHYSENNEEEEKENPFDAIFGKDIYKRMKGNKDYIEKMTMNEFKQQVQWGENLFPQFIIDFIAYISGFLIEDYIKQKKDKEKEEQEQQQLQDVITHRKEAGETVDENFLMEQLKRQRMTDEDQDLVVLKNTIGESVYNKLLRFFKNVCKNPGDTKESQLFLTQESITKKLKNHFGHKCEFLATRFYYLLSHNVNLKRIYFKEFVDKIMVLYEGSLRDMSRFAFKIVDIDGDGILSGPDLLTVQENIDIYSEFGQEILTLVDHYVQTHLMVKNRINPKHFLHLDTYMSLLGGHKSCLIQELQLKILSKEGRYKDKSVLFRDNTKEKQQLVPDSRGRRGLSQVVPNTQHQRQQVKRAILMWTGGNPLKDKKRVTFGYIPAYKDEDDDNYLKRRLKKKLAKDLPTAVIHLPPPNDEENDTALPS